MSDDNYILTAIFPLDTINKNGDIFSIDCTHLPMNSGTITLEHKLSEEEWEKYCNSKYQDVVSMECKYNVRPDV